MTRRRLTGRFFLEIETDELLDDEESDDSSSSYSTSSSSSPSSSGSSYSSSGSSWSSSETSLSSLPLTDNGPATPPIRHLDTAWKGYTGRSYEALTSEDLQRILADPTLPSDSMIWLRAGRSYVGHFRPPATRLTFATPLVPDRRITDDPRDMEMLATLRSPSGSRGRLLDIGFGGQYRFMGVAALSDYHGTAGEPQYGLVVAGKHGDTDPTHIDQLVEEMIWDRCVIKGTAGGNIVNLLNVQARRSGLVKCHIDEGHSTRGNPEAQGLQMLQGDGPHLIEDCFIRIAGIGILFGGGNRNTNGLIPSDITVRRNYFAKNPSWRGTNWVMKNHFELKYARRVLFEDNTLENNWAQNSDQRGYAILLTPRDGVVEDVILRNFRIVNSAHGIQLAPAGDFLRRVLIEDMVYVAREKGAVAMNINGTDGRSVEDLTVRYSTMLADHTWISSEGTRPAARRLKVYYNIASHGQYGIKGSGTNPGWHTAQPWYEERDFHDNVLVGGNAANYRDQEGFTGFHMAGSLGEVFGRDAITDWRECVVPVGSKYEAYGARI